LSLTVLLLALCAVAVVSIDVGDRLLRTYTKYDQLFTNAAAAVQAGFKPVDGHCDPSLGVLYAMDGEVSKKHPTLLYFTTGGQLSGVGVEMFYGNPAQKLIDQNFYTVIGKEEYRINVAFRPQGFACSGEVDSTHIIGDTIVVQPNGANFTIPLQVSEATKAGFHPGACFNGMGTHYFMDLQSHSKPTWEAENLMPVIPMYHDGEINAIFFTTTVVQQGMFGAMNGNQFHSSTL